jgi:hypothetical protein
LESLSSTIETNGAYENKKILIAHWNGGIINEIQIKSDPMEMGFS